MGEAKINGFDDFWNVYPRRVAKQAAMRMYARALKLTTADNILRAATFYAQERAGQDASFTKHPATWLNGGCWDDYAARQGELQKNAPAGFYAAFTSKELEVWDEYGKRTRGRGYPRDKRGGWQFPTRWPPGYNAAADFAGSINDCYQAVKERQEAGGPAWTPK